MSDKDHVFNLEYHTHTFHSNGTMNYIIGDQPASRTIRDSPQTPKEILDSALLRNINVLFIANHNNSDISPILEYKENHAKYDDLRVYPGVEMSCSYVREDGKINRNAHLVGVGIPNGEEYKIADDPAETAQKIKSSGGVPIAPHTRGLTASLMKEGFNRISKYVKVGEVFNSNNLDEYSNTGAFWDVYRHDGMFGIAGSDAHMESGIGLCNIRMVGEKDLDSVLYNLENGLFDVSRTKYASVEYIAKLYRYQTSEPSLLLKSMREKEKHGVPYGRVVEPLAKFGLKAFSGMANHYNIPSSKLVINGAARILMKSMKNISKKLNVFDYSPSVMDLPTMKKIAESYKPLDEDKFGPDRVNLKMFKDPEKPVITRKMINDMNSERRTKKFVIPEIEPEKA